MNKPQFGLFCVLLAVILCLPACAGNGRPDDAVSTAVPVSETLTAVSAETEQNTEPSRDESPSAAPVGADAVELTEGVYAAEVFSYSGAYVEDGSNDPCQGVCAVRLSNRSQVHYQYLNFTLTTSGGTYSFKASTLFADADMTVLCQEKQEFTDSAILSFEIVNLAPFTQTPTVHTDTLLISYTDGFVNVKNLTDATLSDVRIYYKNTDEYGYFGGITYFVSCDDIPAGGTVQKNSPNLHRDTSKVVFANYVP